MSKYKKIEEVSDEFYNDKMHDEDKDLIEAFLGQGHLSDATLKQYKSGILIFSNWVYHNVTPKGKVLLTDLLPRHALAYQNWLIRQGLSSSAIRFKRSAVSSFCGFIEVYYGDLYPNFRNIYSKAIPSVEKTASKEKIPLTGEELDKIKKTLIDKKEWQRLAFLLVAYSTAGRRAELVQLRKEIIDYSIYKDKHGKEQGFYLSHPLRGKGRGIEGKEIRLMISRDAMESIRQWIDERGEDDCEYIFVSKRNGKYQNISVNTINNWVDYFGSIIGRKINPHLIRTTRSTDIVVNEGKDVKFAQRLLNHESSETTDKYYVIRDESEDLGELFS